MSQQNTPSSEKSPRRDRRQKSPKKITKSYLMNSGLYYLQRYATSRAHFEKVMQHKIHRSCIFHNQTNTEEHFALLQEVIAHYIDLGLLDDQAYTRAMVASLRQRGTSRSAILNKLRSKGIDAERTLCVLEEVDKDNHERGLGPLALTDPLSCKAPTCPEHIAALQHAKKKRLGPYRKDDTPLCDKAYKRALSSFARAGFSYSIARDILQMEDTTNGFTDI